MISIWKKELRSLFTGVVGFLYLAAALFIFGVYFYVMNLYQGMAHVSYAYTSCVYLYVVTIPVLTMRSFAQEYHDRTDQLLFTVPVQLWKIVLGKYLAMLTLFMIPILVAACYPLLLTSYGNVALTEAYTTLLGAVLYGMAAIAVGMFISSLTRSTVVAAVVSAVVLFVFYTIGGFAEMLGISVLKKLLGIIDLRDRFLRLESGIISIRAIVYFLVIAAAGVMLTIIRLKQKRGGFGGNGKRRIRRGAAVIITLGTAVLINVIAAVLPDRVTEHDVTVQDFQLLTEQTRMLLDGIDEDIKIYAYVREEDADENVVKMLNNYCEYQYISVEYVNPELSPEFPAKYTANGLDAGSLVVTSGDRFRVIQYSGIYTWSDEAMADAGVSPDGFDLEGQLTSAIDYVTAASIPKVYQLTGHGEFSLEGDFAKSVERENVDLETLSIVASGSIPSDAQCILILAPGQDYSEAEIKEIRSYLDRGGNMYVLLKWNEQPMESLNGLLKEYGITVEQGIVSETDKDIYFQEPYYLIPEIRSTVVTEKLAGNLALSVLTVGMKTDNPDIEPILVTGEEAFLKKNPQEAEKAEWEPGDEKGQYILGLYLERNVDLSESVEGSASVSKKSRIVVFGSPLMTQDSIDEFISGMNLKLFAEIFSHMVSHPIRISVPVKSYTLRYVTVSEADARFFGVILSGILPGLVLAAGIVIAVIRRRR